MSIRCAARVCALTQLALTQLALTQLALVLSVLLALPAGAAEPFAGFITALRPDALKAGVAATTFDTAFAGMTADPQVIRLAGQQPEFNQTIWAYIDARVTPARIRQGQAMAARWTPWLDRIEKTRGVDRYVLLAVWALESNFGASTGGMSTLRSLATLACCTARRPAYFRDELIEALKIVQAGDVTARGMTGSWAGAMGQTQFMPSNFAAAAVDADGDGRRDIWTSVPDALASTAAYLVSRGWQPGRPWGAEVVLPQNFDFHAIDTLDQRPVRAWAEAGLRRADGTPLDVGGLDAGRLDAGSLGGEAASLLLPAGAKGPAFLILKNFWVIKAYNTSDAYALSVGLLADRMRGGPPLSRAWPTGDRALTLAEREALQRRLQGLGYPVDAIDGKIGPAMRAMLRAWQSRNGLVPDGYATPDLLARMGARP